MKSIFEDQVHHISGKISKRYRTCYNHKRVNGLNFTSVHGVRTTPLSPKEIQIRARFTAVRAMIAARKEDLSQITDDQIAFAAQKNEPNGKKTMLAYYWKICGAEYDQQHG